MKFENTSVYNIHNAIYSMRNPKDSWDRSDSKFCGFNGKIENTKIGEKDLNLAQRLINGGSEHRKFMRQIMVSVDITAPLYWWKEETTYKVGTTSNSCSTMHTITKYPITMDCFEIDDFTNFDIESKNEKTGSMSYRVSEVFEILVRDLERIRQMYLETKDKKYWKELIRLLPESWLQKRTITMNYENLYSMVRQRAGHKLTEWQTFIDWVHTLPYADELIFCKPRGNS